MGRNAISALAILLCTLVIGVMVLHERCRLGNQNWQLCGWMGIRMPAAPFRNPEPKEHGPWAVICPHEFATRLTAGIPSSWPAWEASPAPNSSL